MVGQQSSMPTHRAVLLALPLLLVGCDRKPAAPDATAPAETRAEPATPASAFDPVALGAAQRWITYQYLINEPGAAPAMVESFVRGGGHAVDPDANALGVIGVFLGRLGAANPGVLDAWADGAPGLSTEALLVLGYGVWDADPEGAEPRLTRIAAAMHPDDAPALLELIGQRPPDLATLTPDSPGVLDFWWAAFMAAGDTAWVDRVLAVIPAPGVSFEESGLSDPARMEVAKQATWSLTSNAAQHPRVLEHLKRRLAEVGSEWPTVELLISNAEARAAASPPVLPD